MLFQMFLVFQPPAWFHFIDRAMTSEKLRALSNELWDTFVKAPAHARKRVMHLNGELVRAHVRIA